MFTINAAQTATTRIFSNRNMFGTSLFAGCRDQKRITKVMSNGRYASWEQPKVDDMRRCSRVPVGANVTHSHIPVTIGYVQFVRLCIGGEVR